MMFLCIERRTCHILVDLFTIENWTGRKREIPVPFVIVNNLRSAAELR